MEVRKNALFLSLFALPALGHAAETFEGHAFYVGDPHVHTGISGDGGSEDMGNCKSDCGDLSDVFVDARANGLDWITLAEHSNGEDHPVSDSEDFAEGLEMLMDAHDPEGGFVTIPGAEVWAISDDVGEIGHLTVMMFGDNRAIEDLRMEDFQPSGSDRVDIEKCQDLWDWAEDLEDAFGDFLAIPHHPAAVAPMGYNWSCYEEYWQPSVEVYSRHGSSLSPDDTYDRMWSGYCSGSSVHEALDPEGPALKMGFMGGTDSHDTRPGVLCSTDTMHNNHPYGGAHTIVVLGEDDKFDRPAVMDAIIERRTYATTGIPAPVIVEYATGGIRIGGLGDDLGVPAEQDLQVQVRMPLRYATFVDSVTLVTPYERVDVPAIETTAWQAKLEAGGLPEWAYIAIELDGESWYGETDCDDGGDDRQEYLWLSPSWIAEVDPDLDGDGVSWANGDCDDGDATISPDVEETWYDGVDQDCDGNDDDRDGDGHLVADDCDDGDADVHPGAEDASQDGIDQDCDGVDGTTSASQHEGPEDPDADSGVEEAISGLSDSPRSAPVYSGEAGRGCTTAGGSATGALGLLGLLLVAPSRRR